MAKLNKEDFISALKEMSLLEIKELVDATVRKMSFRKYWLVVFAQRDKLMVK